MAILIETSGKTRNIIEENKSGEKSLYIEGVMAQYDIVNRNKRIYPKEVLESAMNAYKKDYLDKNMAACELNHPNHLEIDATKIAARIVEISEEGSCYKGKALVVDTPMGNIVKGLIRGGFTLGVSTRAKGSVMESASGVLIVQPDLKLVAIDIVTSPSGPDCYVKGIMESGSDFWSTIEEYADANLIESFRNEMRGMTTKQIQENKLNLFKKFMDVITTKM